MPKPLKTFIIYAREDAAFKNELLRQLAPFAQMGLLEKWDDSHILPGEEWEKSIEKALEASQIVLMLVSADSLFSDFIQRKELRKALEQKREGITRVIPILVRDCLYDMAEGIHELQMLPLHPVSRSLTPVDDLAIWGSRASAWATALRQLREVVTDVHARIEAEEKIQLAEAERLAEMKAKEVAAAEALAAEEAARIQREKDAQAKIKLHRSKDEAAWKVALELNTLEAYEVYSEKYNLHEVEAHERIGKLEEAEARRRAEQKAKDKAEAARKAKEAELAAEAKRRKDEAERKKHEQEAALATEAKREKEAEKKRRDAEEAVRQLDPFEGLMIPIKGGTFEMGGRNITLTDFQLSKYLVTQANWELITGTNPSGNRKGGDFPVENISWDEVQVFIQKLNNKTGKKYRLPSDAEWEFAAKGGVKSKNYQFAGSNNIDEVGWYSGNSGYKTHPVGQKKGNELGLYDMSGNVFEWCEDDFGSSNNTPSNGKAHVKSPRDGSRVYRGGCMNHGSNYSHVENRNAWSANGKRDLIGFRLAL